MISGVIWTLVKSATSPKTTEITLERQYPNENKYLTNSAFVIDTAKICWNCKSHHGTNEFLKRFDSKI